MKELHERVALLQALCQEQCASPLNYSMGRHKRPRSEVALVTVMPDPEVYMSGLSKQVMALSDATLLIQSHQLPVHSFILAANSPVLADLFETAFTADDSTVGRAAGSGPKSGRDKTMIQLDGDSVTDMCTALRYCYMGCNLSSPDRPKLSNCKEAAGLVRVAHKYNMQGLHREAEKYLIAKASSNGGKDMFEDPSSLVEWVVLAESCKLDELLAHAELYMIKHTEVGFWQEVMSRNSISIGCFLRVLRRNVHFRQKVDKLLQDQLANASAASYVVDYGTYGGGSCQCMVQAKTTDAQAMTTGMKESDVTVEMLLQWHKEGA